MKRFISLFIPPLMWFVFLSGKSSAQQNTGKLFFGDAVLFYLMQDCGLGDADASSYLKIILSEKVKAVPLMFDALENGPPKSRLDSTEIMLRDDYKRMKEFLASEGLSALKDTGIKTQARSLSEETYMNMRRKGFIEGYRERALNALLFMKDKEILKRLKQISESEKLSDDIKKMIRSEIK